MHELRASSQIIPKTSQSASLAQTPVSMQTPVASSQ
jgi:hypothetical protein